MIAISEIETILFQLGKLYTSKFGVYKCELDFEEFFLIKEECDGTFIEYKLTKKLFEGLKETLIQKPIVNDWIMNESYRLMDSNQSIKSFMEYGINHKTFSFYDDDECEVDCI